MEKFNIVFLFAGHVTIWSMVIATTFYLIDQIWKKWRNFKYVTMGVKRMSVHELEELRSECEKQIVDRLEQQRLAEKTHYTHL